MLGLEDIDQNVPGYGNHNQVYTVGYGQLEITKVLHTSKRLVRFNSNFEFTSLE